MQVTHANSTFSNSCAPSDHRKQERKSPEPDSLCYSDFTRICATVTSHTYVCYRDMMLCGLHTLQHLTEVGTHSSTLLGGSEGTEEPGDTHHLLDSCSITEKSLLSQ